MLKRFFAFLISFALITQPIMAEGLDGSDLNFAFGQSDRPISELSSDLSLMTDQQMSETEGEWFSVLSKVYKVYKKAKKSWGRKGGKSNKHTKNARPSTNDTRTKPRAGRTNTKNRFHDGWAQR